jgi:UDP-N-acetylmuramyl pentapeptide phosphotransferase/UDP-N-acetylglucosamine-1-phosphate transferase
MREPAVVALFFFLLTPIGMLAAMVSAGLNLLLLPWLRSYALARPNARSLHSAPTPQGGGAAVLVATFAVAWGGTVLISSAMASSDVERLAALTAGALLLAVVGAVDDLRPLPPLPRLLLQGIACGFVVALLPAELRLIPALPIAVERVAMLLAGIWFVNLTNFMDGIDWMTVVEVVPITIAIVLLWLMGSLPLLPALVALALAGAMVGFAPFNWPVARLFLGDVGSLPIGLLLAWLLLHVAARGEFAAALILPLYYVADASVTLLRRLIAGKPIWQAHRTHFYQRARTGGFTVEAIVARVLMLNIALVVLAIASAATDNRAISLALFVAAAILVALRLLDFARGKT